MPSHRSTMQSASNVEMSDAFVEMWIERARMVGTPIRFVGIHSIPTFRTPMEFRASLVSRDDPRSGFLRQHTVE